MGAAGAPVRRGQGCHVQDTASSMWPTTGHGWALQPRWWRLWGGVFKGRDRHWDVKGKKMWETTLWAPRSEKKELLQALEQGFPCSPSSTTVEQYPHCSPRRASHQSRGICPEGTAVHGQPMQAERVFSWRDCITWEGLMLEQGKNVRTKKRPREMLWTDCKPPSASLCTVQGQGGGRGVGNEEGSWAWEEVEGGTILTFVFVSNYPNLF